MHACRADVVKLVGDVVCPVRCILLNPMLERSLSDSRPPKFFGTKAATQAKYYEWVVWWSCIYTVSSFPLARLPVW